MTPPSPSTTDPTELPETEDDAESPDGEEVADAGAVRPWDPGLAGRVAKGGLAVVVLVVALVIVLPRLSGGGDDAPDGQDGKEPGAGAEASSGAGAPQAAAPSGAGSQGGDPAAAPGAADLVRLGRPAPAALGDHELKVTFADRVVTGTYTVRAGANDHTQVHRTELEGAVSEQQLSWGSRGVSLVSTEDATAGTCSWSPAPLLLPADVEVGSSWSTESDCEVTGNGATLTVRQESSAQVVERGQTDVGGTAVEVWVVQRKETQTRGIGETDVVSSVVSSELFAPQLGLVVERVTRADVVQADGSSTPVSVIEELESL